MIISGISVQSRLAHALQTQQQHSFSSELLPGYDIDLSELLQTGLVDSQQAEMPLRQWIGEAMADYRCRLESNCGFLAEMPWDCEERELKGLRFEGIKPFKIHQRRKLLTAIRASKGSSQARSVAGNEGTSCPRR